VRAVRLKVAAAADLVEDRRANVGCRGKAQGGRSHEKGCSELHDCCMIDDSVGVFEVEVMFDFSRAEYSDLCIRTLVIRA
jgi:hypothetical protein